MRSTDRKLPFSYLLMGVLAVVIVTVVLAGIWTNYETSRSNLETNANRLRGISEDHINEHLRLIHTGLKIYDGRFNEEMEDAFAVVMAEYNRASGDPSQMGLPGLKARIGGMDVSVINDSDIVEYTTKPADLGLNIPIASPDFVVYLRGIRNTSGFYPDRVFHDPVTGNLAKSGYMPTADHRYIIELGLSDVPVSEGWMELQYNDVVEDVRAFNPYLDGVLLFQASKRLINDASYVPTTEEYAMLDYLLGKNRTTQVVRNPVSKRTVVWEVVDMRDPDYIADMSVIAKLTYNDGLLADEQTALASVHALAALLVLLTGGLLAITVSRRVSRPIEQLVEDVDAVAGGDLDHAIRPVAWFEFSTLAEKTGVMVDRLKEQIRQREESEQRFSDLVQFLPLGVFETDLEGNVTFANPAALEVVGIGVDELRRVLNISAVIAPEDRARARESFIAILEGGKTEGSEYTGRRSDGSTFSMLTYTSVRYENGAIAGVRGSIVDISRLKQIEEEMRRMNAELEERVAQRTQELEAFTYSVSHDLRAPLRAIDGYSAILYEAIGPKLEEKDKRYLDQVRGIVRQMNGLIDGLLALSRLDRQELTCERISPAPLVREVVAVVLEQEPDHAVTVTVGDLPPCRADRAMLRQVYANLIGNAVKFSRHADSPRVEVGATGEGAETVYFVRDNGVGFEMADAELIFRPFQRLHRSDRFEGSGIGLATVDRIVRRHGGRVWAESTPGEGSTFFFTLPSA